MNQKKRLLKPGAFKRLVKMLMSFYPVMLPTIIVLIIVNAVIGALPSIFMQNVTAVIENALNTGASWEETQPQVMHYVLILACLYGLALLVSFYLQSADGILYTGIFIQDQRKDVCPHGVTANPLL